MIGRRPFVATLHSAAALTAALMFTVRAPAEADVSIRGIRNPSVTNKVTVEVIGLDSTKLSELQRANWKTDRWPELFSVYVDQPDLAGNLFLPPMLGSYTVKQSALRFEPQFALEPGVRYRAVFRPDRLPGTGRAVAPSTAALLSTFSLPNPPREATTRVSQIYPSSDLLPENLLKFYVHFSAPMGRGGIYDHIHLREISGREIELPFLQIDEELWDANMTRLTLFIDPGRIKRGVLPLEEVGPALEAKKKYQLIIDQGWKDAAGNPLKDTFTKTFTVGPPDRDPPDPKQWKIDSPKSQTGDALTIVFPEPMERALALRLISVARDSGEPLPGTKTLRDNETRWLFTPDSAWMAGKYSLAVQTHIEDLAGNNIGKPFEVDLFESVQRRLTNSVVKLPFEVK